MTIYKKRASFLVFGSPAIAEDDIQAVVNVLRSGWIGTGPEVARFKETFAAYKQAKYAVAVNSATAALHLSFLALDLKPGDEVITTANTFCSTINSIIHSGATPVLVDIEPNTLNIDPAKIKAAITANTRAICPVHFAGLPCDMNEICEISEEYGLAIIEDCAHAIEGAYRGRSVGTIGDFGCFSFYVTKNVVTAEGGMILAREKLDIDRLNVLALHGMSRDAWKRFSDGGYKHYEVTEVGFKYNMTDIQAAMGIQQLARVESNWLRRKDIWDAYKYRLKDIKIRLPENANSLDRHALHLFPIRIDESRLQISRDDFISQMTARNIGVGVHYLSIPEHPIYQKLFGWSPDDFPYAKEYGRQTVSLPLSAKLNDDDVEDVILAIEDILS
jgi:dTDP-4-amino-4,6-dideoxygalactose transaminase